MYPWNSPCANATAQDGASPFKELVARAVDEGLVQDKGFSHVREREFDEPEIRHLPPEFRQYILYPPANSYAAPHRRKLGSGLRGFHQPAIRTPRGVKAEVS